MENQDPIKDAFSRAKQDIQYLKEQLALLANEMLDLKSLIEQLKVQQTDRQSSIQSSNEQISPQLDEGAVLSPDFPTQTTPNQSYLTEHFDNPTDDYPYKRLKPHIYKISIGNDGVPTNRQTDKQTNTNPNTSTGDIEFNKIPELLNSLDTIKKELRNKFKRLTKQEMLVFSTIYQLEEENFDVDYSLIAKKLSLSESSIRDYIQRMVKKGIPLDKIRENNKKIYLKISTDLKQIASLNTIIQLREI
jgi:DNA-binding MarR family transcriptional regulator